jgi:hypothetical protein
VSLSRRGDLVTLAEWDVFTEKFKLMRNRVVDRTESEERNLLMKQLPSFWIKLVGWEDQKKRSKNWSVRISNLPEMSLDDVQHELEEALGCRLNRPTPTTGGIIIACRDENVAQRLLDLAGDDLGFLGG